jgi:TonB family protein
MAWLCQLTRPASWHRSSQSVCPSTGYFRYTRTYMRHLSIGCGVAAFLLAGGLACAQEKPTPSQDLPPPFLKQCSDKNPPPCADKPPVVTYAPNPECSKEANKAKVNATVVLTVVVGTDGLAHDIVVVRSGGYGLDEQAVKAVKKWKFKPAMGSTKPAPVQIHIQSEFHCRG